jgi:hypothetical protein
MAELPIELFVRLDPTEVPGEYDEGEQAWSIECDAQRSPQKHHQEQ